MSVTPFHAGLPRVLGACLLATVAAGLTSLPAQADTSTGTAQKPSKRVRVFAPHPVQLSIPDLPMQDQSGRTVRLPEVLATDRPVYVNFIFTTCTTVCPVMSQIFVQLQQQLKQQGLKARLVSVSIDPLEDTPARLSAYAKRFGADEHWRFLTGTAQASVQAQEAFHIYIRDKMNHPVVTFFRSRPGAEWIQVDGFAAPEQLVSLMKP